MKKIIILLFACLPFAGMHAQIFAYFSQCAFNTPDNKPYAETYLSISGKSISFKKNAAGKYQGAAEVGILFSQNGVIKASKKYNLLSPEQNDTLNRPNFIDQQRFSLEPGEYELEEMVSDKNGNGKTFSMKKKIKIDFPADKVNVSDIELLSSFSKSQTKSMVTKNGFDLIPYMADGFYPEDVKEISFYAEVYNTKAVLGDSSKFLISYYIESYENKKMLEKFTAFRRETSAPVNLLLTKFNITDLPSGNYNLVVDVRNKSNESVSQRKLMFQRLNSKAKINTDDLSNVIVENTFASKITNKDSIAEFIRSLRPAASESEKVFLDNNLKTADVKLMQQFFYNFWQTRNALAPEEEWNKYAQTTAAVNKKYGTFVYKGYETDRGRVYLQYGPPDKMESYPSEPNAFPYEIWLYYTLSDKSKLNPNQTNKQFIFYNSDLATNNYQVLNSNALSEVHDANWEMKLHMRTVQSNDFEHKNAPEHYGGSSHDEFNNPK